MVWILASVISALLITLLATKSIEPCHPEKRD